MLPNLSGYYWGWGRSFLTVALFRPSTLQPFAKTLSTETVKTINPPCVREAVSSTTNNYKTTKTFIFTGCSSNFNSISSVLGTGSPNRSTVGVSWGQTNSRSSFSTARLLLEQVEFSAASGRASSGTLARIVRSCNQGGSCNYWGWGWGKTASRKTAEKVRRICLLPNGRWKEKMPLWGRAPKTFYWMFSIKQH